MSYGCRQLWFWIFFLTPITSLAITLNGFNLDNASVPQSLIQRGGPPRDGIPAIDNPKFVSAAAASYLRSDDIVLGLNVDGVAKAYPLRILNWHEIVNDRIGDTHYLISYCPLCGSGMAFESYSGLPGTRFILTPRYIGHNNSGIGQPSVVCKVHTPCEISSATLKQQV